jgi:hypothetical protein
MANGASFKTLETEGKELTSLNDDDQFFVGDSNSSATDGSPELNFIKAKNMTAYSANVAGRLYLYSNCV